MWLNFVDTITIWRDNVVKIGNMMLIAVKEMLVVKIFYFQNFSIFYAKLKIVNTVKSSVIDFLLFLGFYIHFLCICKISSNQLI